MMTELMTELNDHDNDSKRNDALTLSTQGKIISRQHFEIFYSFLPEKRIWHSMHIVSNGKMCMQSQILFSGKNKKYINLSSAKFAQRVVKVNGTGYTR